MLGWESTKHWASAALDLLRFGLPFLRRGPGGADKNNKRIIETRQIQETSHTIVQVQRVLVTKTITTHTEQKEQPGK